MISSKFQKRLHEYRIGRLRAEMNDHKQHQKKRQKSFMISIFSLPIFLPYYLLALVIYKATKNHKHPIIRQFCKLYFRSFFYFSGVRITTIFPVVTLKKPSIIFTVRNTDMTGAFLLTLFKQNINIPYSKFFSYFPLNRYLPFLKLGPLIKSIGYEDKPLAELMDDIKTTLDSGRSILLYLNPKTLNHRHNTKLEIYEELFDLLELSVDTYFLRCKNLELYTLGNLFHARNVDIHFHSKEELLEHIPDKKDTIVLAIKEFYDFKTAETSDK